MVVPGQEPRQNGMVLPQGAGVGTAALPWAGAPPPEMLASLMAHLPWLARVGALLTASTVFTPMWGEMERAQLVPVQFETPRLLVASTEGSGGERLGH